MADKLPVIIDNRDDNTILALLKQLFPSLQNTDFATGFFEIGSFFLLDRLWQDLKRICITSRNQTTKYTKNLILGLNLSQSNQSIEQRRELG